LPHYNNFGLIKKAHQLDELKSLTSLPIKKTAAQAAEEIQRNACILLNLIRGAAWIADETWLIDRRSADSKEQSGKQILFHVLDFWDEIICMNGMQNLEKMNWCSFMYHLSDICPIERIAIHGNDRWIMQTVD